MNVMQQYYRDMAAVLDRVETEAITKALCDALGLAECNPREYMARLTAQIRGGDRYVLLDGRDLIVIYPLKTEWFHEEMSCTLSTRYLWQDNKKPAV